MEFTSYRWKVIKKKEEFVGQFFLLLHCKLERNGIFVNGGGGEEGGQGGGGYIFVKIS